ncbi:MAG TPA: hypothetical protein VLK82_04510 [Candidatus Tectomicrobia bacterium]|nr:hypothetical protein [Candidatus Tectomicrobia bacterium]
MVYEGTAARLMFNQFGDFHGLESPGSSSISDYIVISDPLHISLGEWIRLDLGNDHLAYCWHNPFTCDCWIWFRDTWTDDLTFTLSYDQRGKFIQVQFADNEAKTMPDHNMMRGTPMGRAVASRHLGELIRLELEADRYAFYYHRPTQEVYPV